MSKGIFGKKVPKGKEGIFLEKKNNQEKNGSGVMVGICPLERRTTSKTLVELGTLTEMIPKQYHETIKSPTNVFFS